MPIKIKYRFKDESTFYSCIVSYQQYQNFRRLPVITECRIIDQDVLSSPDMINEIQKALDNAFENNTSHIRKLSDVF